VADEKKDSPARGLAGAPSAPATMPTLAEQEVPKPPEVAERRKEATGLAMRGAKAEEERLHDKVATSQPSPLASEPADKGPTTRPEVASAPAATPAPVAMKKALTEEPAPAGTEARSRAMQRRDDLNESAKDATKDFEKRQDAAIAPTTQPTTQPTDLAVSKLSALPQLQLKLTADDAPRMVLIVVNPVILPVVSEPTTQPTAASATPTTQPQPAAKPDTGK
jgi:hypothetical protein